MLVFAERRVDQHTQRKIIAEKLLQQLRKEVATLHFQS
jgi:hypothetical protein